MSQEISPMIQANVTKIRAAYPQFTPKVGLVLGSGLGGIADAIKDAKVFEYTTLEGFPRSSVEGHAGKLILGYLHGVPVACLQGRAHWYEGVASSAVKVLIRTLKSLGCDLYLGTNAVGSLHAEVGPGSLVAICDHINLQPMNPLVGPNEKEAGPRFVGMDNAYDRDLRQLLQRAATSIHLPLSEGVYCAVLGPMFETPAEIRAFRTLGADVVGMSTVPEVIVARHAGMKVVVISAVTNLAAGMSNEHITHEGTLHYGAQTASAMADLLAAFMPLLPSVL